MLTVSENARAVIEGLTASEELGIGQDEFVPWQLGSVT